MVLISVWQERVTLIQYSEAPVRLYRQILVVKDGLRQEPGFRLQKVARIFMETTVSGTIDRMSCACSPVASGTPRRLLVSGRCSCTPPARTRPTTLGFAALPICKHVRSRESVSAEF